MAEQYEAPAAQWNGNITLNLGGFRTLIFTHAEELVDAQVAEQSKTINPKDGSITFLPADSPGLQVYKTLDERYENVEKSLQKLIANEETEKFANTIKEVLQITKDESKDGTELYEAYQILLALSSSAPVGARGNNQLQFTVDSAEDSVTLQFTNTSSSSAKPIVEEDKNTLNFLNSVSQLLSDARNSNLNLTPDQVIAVRTAYTLIEKGHFLPRPYTALGAPGTRKHQTLLFVTDAGADNIKITCQSPRLLDGVTVHTEYIDRSESKDKSLVEAYRLPSHIDAGKVRLHVGTDAPCSCYIGRPIFEGLNYKGTFEEFSEIYREKNQAQDYQPADFFFEANLLKTAHFWASACSAMFANGIVDCKIAIERMNEEQAIKFMKAVRANVVRDPETQYLSAAFNLYTPILNARGELVTNQIEIAKLAIKITKFGGFDKVTWDGASTKVPSDPVTTILPFPKLLELVHLAHEQGLLTYISAGLTLENLADPVYAGVDGCGIGNDLHYLSSGQQKVVGALNPDKITGVINARNEAEKSIFGQGGKLLAKLDYKFFEGSLETSEQELRTDLYTALLNRNSVDIEEIIRKAHDISKDISPIDKKDKCNRILLAAYRLLNARSSIISGLVDESRELLQKLYQRKDISGLRSTIEHIKKQRQTVAFFSPVRIPNIKSKPDTPLVQRRPQAASFLADGHGISEHIVHLPQKIRKTPLNAGINNIAASRTKVFSNGKNFLQNLSRKIQKRSQLGGHLFQHNVVLVDVDISTQPADCLGDADLTGVYIIGNIDLPQGLTEEQLIAKGAVIIKPKLDLPFDPTRSDLYTVEELQKSDTLIYNWVHARMGEGKSSTVQERVMIDLHDSQILAALRLYVANKYVVGIMGGHAMLRGDPVYTQIALLCRKLALQNFVVVTGGGPGAMEAANLGAYFRDYEERDLLNAIAMLQVNKNLDPSAPEYTNSIVADEVLQKYYREDAGEYSLGVPTFFYGHEPYNRFALKQAKFVSNAIREDILVNICNCGIIFAPGAAGTRTEIYQYAVPNAYATEERNNFSKPMIFLGAFWLENGVFQSVANVAQKEDAAKNRPTGYSTKIYCVKESEQVVSIIQSFKKTYYDPEKFPTPTKPPVDPEDSAKRLVAQFAVDKYVTRSEMKIGVGSGTTVKHVIDHLSTLAKQNNWHLECVPSSLATRDALLKKKNLVVRSLLETPFVDVVFDGTDETDVFLNQIKGGGGALMQEKILASGTNQFVIIADSRKESAYLGQREFPVPIEVNILAYKRVKSAIVSQYGVEVKLRKAGQAQQGPYLTDNSNVILDAFFKKDQLADPTLLEHWIKKIPGVLEIGIFTGMVARSFFTSADGKSVHERTRLFDLRDANLNLITPAKQFSSLHKVLEAVRNTPNAVVEMDLDLAAISPFERTISGVQKAGQDYNIPEFADPQRYFRELPGYTLDAWNSWINSNELQSFRAKYPHLPWEAKNKAYEFTPFGEANATVWSSFHIRFWESGVLVSRDVPTAGLAKFEQLVRQAGGKVVFISGRWTDEQIRGTNVALKKSGIPRDHIHLLIGNPDKKYSDSENKIRFQDIIKEKYGTPVAFFDDRKSNLDALKRVIPSLITVAVAIPGYSAASDVLNAENAVATFELDGVEEIEDLPAPLFESFEHAQFRGVALTRQPKPKPPATSPESVTVGAPIPKPVSADGREVIRVGSFNVENLFSRFKFKSGAKDQFGNDQLQRSLNFESDKRITADALKKLNADVLALEEVEDIQTLEYFIKKYLPDQGYEYRALIEGNDTRGIDVAIISRLPIIHLRSYKNDKNAAGELVFSRDCLEVTVQIPTNSKKFKLYINHFKSMSGSREETAPKRRAQVERVLEIITTNHGQDLDQGKPFVVLGDFNDYIDNEQDSAIWPLVKHLGLSNPVELLPATEQWTHYWAGGNDYHQLDFVLLSSALQQGQIPHVVREGQPTRATRYQGPRFAGVGYDRPKASDHCPLGVDILL